MHRKTRPDTLKLPLAAPNPYLMKHAAIGLENYTSVSPCVLLASRSARTACTSAWLSRDSVACFGAGDARTASSISSAYTYLRSHDLLKRRKQSLPGHALHNMRCPASYSPSEGLQK